MESFTGPGSPQQTLDYPKPETGLAEWTSKIKALQRQVDEDEEAEQRKLEEEIAAARRARLRRSRGYADQNDNPAFSDFRERVTHSRDAIESSMSPSDRQTGQGDALRKLMGNTQDPITSVKPSMNTSSRTTNVHTEPISLAAFIGGRATGPRLNKPASQQNAHDPTQFVDPIPKAPHPVFGRGGVALPGLTSGKPSAIKTMKQEDPEAVERYKPSFAVKSSNVPSVAQRYVGILGQQTKSPVVEHPNPVSTTRPESPVKRGTSPSKVGLRERTISSPSLSVHSGPAQGTTQPRENTTSTSMVRSFSRSPISPTSPSIAPTAIRRSPTLKPSASTPSLSRPIIPEPRPVSTGPHIPASVVPSPAFQKPPPTKELTPSISRLQGRGFVQNMVKASSQFQSSVQPIQERPRSTPRKASVLDRWQPNDTANTSSASSPSSLQSIPKRKSMPSIQVQPDPKPQISPLATSSFLKSPDIDRKPTRSEPRVQQSMQVQPDPKPLVSPKTHALKPFKLPTDTEHKSTLSQQRTQPADDSLLEKDPNLGSATTMVVYKPERNDEEVTEFHMVDELGVKRDTPPVSRGQVRFQDASGIPEPSAKPLSHPTKERARKPRRSKTSSGVVKDDSSTHSAYNKSTSLRASSTPSITTSLSTNVDHGVRESSMKPTTNVGRIVGNWGESPPIAVKVVSPTSTPSPSIPKKSFTPLRQALPGMTTPQQPPQFAAEVEPEQLKPSKVLPSSPRHARIPSTGNRATVMEIASALSQRDDVPGPQAISKANSLPEAGSSTSIDVRRSAYEHFSPPVMPVLKEEASPVVSPAGTLSLKVTTQSSRPNLQENTPPISSRLVPSCDTVSDERQKKSKTVHFDIPLPKVDIDALINFRNKTSVQSHDSQTIQVEVLSVVGSTANVLSQNTDTFYDTEVLAIVHRSKSKATGLAMATVWGWKGRRSHYSSREELKLQELAKRYGTKACMVQQFSEPTHLVHVLGGQLTIRQGSRSHWTAENTAMYLIRSVQGVVLIDEYDLSIKNLCSAFSYCLSILNTIYVWHGCGSTTLERQAALWYAQSLSPNSSLVELSEGENDNDEMFWMILGEDSFAKADYWKWRKSSPLTDPAIWRVDASLSNDSVTPISFISQEKSPELSVYIVDCVWELFIMVGSNARGERQNIKLALDVAIAFSERAASARPYTPTVHVLVLPSRLPLDLRMNVRDLDELSLNNGNIPDHMNLLSSSEALDHMQKRSWERDALSDTTMLPLGLDVSHAATA